MRSIIRKVPPKPLITRFLSTQTTRPEKLNRIADELLSLNPIELHDYTILFGLKMGLKSAPSPSLSSGVGPSGQARPVSGTGAGSKPVEEKTVFDVKLEKFDAGSKIKIIKEVRTFTDLGLKDAKELVEKTPVVVKKGVTKEEADSIVAKLKLLGASVLLE